MRLRETAKLTVAVLLLTLSAFAQNRQDIVDDGFTWFEAYSTTELQGNNIPTATGWTLKYWVRVIGNYPDGSGLKFVVTKAGRTVFSTRCGAWAYRKTANDVDESFLRTAECWQGKSATKETGEFEVGVFVVNGATNQEQFVRTYKIDVRTVARVPSGQEPEQIRRVTTSIATTRRRFRSSSFVQAAISRTLTFRSVPSGAARITLSSISAFHLPTSAKISRTESCDAR
ncbi:MAG: hypothetical protein IPJ30_19835 [Acidobacteria bacterium]|nr:hypothetical protein [Acidobacteriota bacterium]